MSNKSLLPMIRIGLLKGAKPNFKLLGKRQGDIEISFKEVINNPTGTNKNLRKNVITLSYKLRMKILI